MDKDGSNSNWLQEKLNSRLMTAIPLIFLFSSQRELCSGFDHLTIKASKWCIGTHEVKTLIV